MVIIMNGTDKSQVSIESRRVTKLFRWLAVAGDKTGCLGHILGLWRRALDAHGQEAGLQGGQRNEARKLGQRM